MTERRQHMIAVLLALLVLGVGFNQAVRQTNLQRDACERGNALRKVVFRNTRTAVRQAADLGIRDSYGLNLAILLAPDTVDDETGTVDCEEAVPMPWPIRYVVE